VLARTPPTLDALAAEVEGSTGAVLVFELDVHKSDIAFDVAPLSESELLVVGASGHSRNPNGASISEDAYVLSRSGATRALDVPNRARNNGTRSLAQTTNGRWLSAGMLDGPGTHSGDADASLVRADGFLVDLRVR
jgi:hypothetical protein